MPVFRWDANAFVDLRTGRRVTRDVDPAYIPGWGLPTFRDEFDTPGAPDPAKWNVRDRSGFGLLNDATVIKSEQCVVTSNGLEIRGEWLPQNQWEYTATGPQAPENTLRAMKTGYLEHRRTTGSDTIYSQRYGIWEYRVKLPIATGNSQGTLPAVWLRNTKTGEIDMTEGWGSGPSGTPAKTGWYPAQPKPNAGRTTFTIHSNTSGGGTKEAWTQPSPAIFDGWATYRFVYTPDVFAFYRKRDGLDPDFVEQFYLTPTSHRSIAGTLSGTTPASQTHFAKFWTDTDAYDGPWHIRMNLHIGPSTAYWGVPDPDHPEWTDNPVMLVDYVRIYNYDNREA